MNYQDKPKDEVIEELQKLQQAYRDLQMLYENSIALHRPTDYEGKHEQPDYRDTIDNLELIFNTIPDAAIISRLDDGMVTDVNVGFTKLTGFTREEVLGKSSNEIKLWKNQDDRLIVVNKIREQGFCENFEAMFLHKNGSGITGLMSAKAFMIKDIPHILSITRDITERKQIEVALVESERKLNEAQHVGNVGSWEYDFVNQKLFWSDQVYLMYELSKESYVPDMDKAFLSTHIDDQKNLEDKYFDSLKNKTNFDLESRIITSSGAIKHIMTRASSKFDKEGNPIRMLGTIVDITERKVAEEALKTSEEKYRLITENTADVIWILNLSKQKFTYISPSVYNLRGYTQDEAMSQTLTEALTPESLKIVINGVERTLPEFLEYKDTNRTRQLNEIQQPCKNGDIIWIEVATQYQFNAEGEVEVLGVSRNIEQRKRMEEVLHKSEASLKASNAAKDKFFSIIAHDLKSPFNSILGLSEYLVEQVHERKIKEFEKIADTIKTSARNTFELLTNLLEWSRSQTGKLEFCPEHFELTKTIEQVIKLANDAARQKSITISHDLPKDIIVYADKHMLETVLRNLVTNAIKYSHVGGLIEIKIEPYPEKCVVTISDNGVGIPKEAINKLFNIGATFSTRGTRNEHGTGLGLIICQEFIEKHNGKIWVESEVGKGSDFRFSIP